MFIEPVRIKISQTPTWTKHPTEPPIFGGSDFSVSRHKPGDNDMPFALRDATVAERETGPTEFQSLARGDWGNDENLGMEKWKKYLYLSQFISSRAM